MPQRVWSVIGCYDCFKLEGCEKGLGGGSEDEVLKFEILNLDGD